MTGLDLQYAERAANEEQYDPGYEHWDTDHAHTDGEAHSHGAPYHNVLCGVLTPAHVTWNRMRERSHTVAHK